MFKTVLNSTIQIMIEKIIREVIRSEQRKPISCGLRKLDAVVWTRCNLDVAVWTQCQFRRQQI